MLLPFKKLSKVKFQILGEKKYQSINTFAQKNSNLQDFLKFPLPSFIVFYVSEISYIQCIVCIAAVYFEILRCQYFKLLGRSDSFISHETYVLFFLLLVIAIMLFFRLVGPQAFSGLTPHSKSYCKLPIEESGISLFFSF